MLKRVCAVLLVFLLVVPLAGLAEGLVLTEELVTHLPEGQFYKVGAVFTNQGDKPVGITMPEFKIYDKAGEMLDSASSMAVPTPIAPGESAYFSMQLFEVDEEKLATIDRHELLFEEKEGGEGLHSLPVTLLSQLDQLSEDDGIKASVVNTSGAEINSYRQVWVLRDGEGKLIDISVTRGLLFAPVAAGESYEIAYFFDGWNPSLAYCLEKGLAEGSVLCLVFGIP